MTVSTLEATAVQQLKMSYEEYLNIATDAQIMEWANGEVIVYMPPIYAHQNVVSFLDRILSNFIDQFRLGVLVLAPFEVKLWPDGPSREPDLLFVRQENSQKLTEKRFIGGPDLVVEIVSPSSVTVDRIEKFAEYEQAGIQEYWIIDPRPFQRQAEFFVRGENGRFQAALLTDDGRFYSTVLTNFWLHAGWFLTDDLPNPQLCLAEIMLTVESLSAQAQIAYQAMYDFFSQDNR
ncbi:MAG: Uma2 family endonuclease [Chloroflexi bacterium]|nr:Uma2 family endonuclease [Chloroflexota bacterium]